mgnify:CR=1 FL=1
MVAITLTQDTYRLWARIGPSVLTNGVVVTPSTASVLAQLAQLAADSVVHETP